MYEDYTETFINKDGKFIRTLILLVIVMIADMYMYMYIKMNKIQYVYVNQLEPRVSDGTFALTALSCIVTVSH